MSNLLPLALATANALKRKSAAAEFVDPNSPLGGLYRPPVGGGPETDLQYPIDIRNDNFFTVFRAYERSVSFNSPGRLAVSGKNDLWAEIVLPLPPNLGTTYSVDYGFDSLGATGSALAAATVASAQATRADTSIGATVSAALGTLADVATDGVGLDSLEGWKNLAKNAGIAAGRQILPTGVETGLNIAKNPYQAVVFQSPKFRTHSFEYTLFARNKEETEVINTIITQFKMLMMPSFPDNTGLYFKYPKVFDIEYHAGLPNNRFLHRISTSALTDFSVSYHGEGTPSYFDDESEPRPTSMKISMTFQELNFLTQEMVIQGY